MSFTVEQLIKAAMRKIGAIASGETPSTDEYSDGLEELQSMLQSWSARALRLWYVTTETFSLTGASYYTIGSGGTWSTVRPAQVRGAVVRDSYGNDFVLDLLDEAGYRRLKTKTDTGTCEGIWYSPEYPLGKIYVWPTGGSSIILDSLKPLTAPTAVTNTVSFPDEYNEAMRWGLCLRMGPEFGKDPSPIQVKLASDSLERLESKNFAEQISAVRSELAGDMRGRYNIDEG